MKKILSIILLLLPIALFAQNRTMDFIGKLSAVHVSNGAMVEVKMDGQAQRSVLQMQQTPEISGFRICIFFDNSQSGRENGNSALYQFRSSYPDVPCDMTYIQPTYKIHVGNYITRSEANMMLGIYQVSFPKAFIVPMNLPITLFVNQRSSTDGVVEESR